MIEMVGVIGHARNNPFRSTRLKAAPPRSARYGPSCKLAWKPFASGTILRDCIKDAPTVFSPIPQTGLWTFAHPCGEALPSVICDRDEVSLQGLIVVNASSGAKDRAPRDRRLTKAEPMLGGPRDGFVAKNPRPDFEVVSCKLLARDSPGGAIENISPE